jgi:hypothetical protein
VVAVAQRAAAELGWVFRPEDTRSAHIRALAGIPVHATGPVAEDGTRELVLGNGARVRATPTEIVAE